MTKVTVFFNWLNYNNCLLVKQLFSLAIPDRSADTSTVAELFKKFVTSSKNEEARTQDSKALTPSSMLKSGVYLMLVARHDETADCFRYKVETKNLNF